MTVSQYPLEAYAPFYSGSGAEKLRSSGVAPLVALARGYRTFPAQGELVRDRDQRDSVIKEILNLAKPSNKASAAKQTEAMLKQGDDADILMLPWYSAVRVAEGKKTFLDATYTQLRPRYRPKNAQGEAAPKYTSFAGSDTAIDIHVSSPTEWVRAPRKALITEGVLKGDSALTAQLADVPEIGREALEVPEDLHAKGMDDAIRAATKKLRSLMGKVPRKDRVLIISLVGVANWNQGDWAGVVLSDANVSIAFDGDLRENYRVYGQFEALCDYLTDKKKAAKASLMDLGGPTATSMALTAGWAGGEKVGLDDFLAHPVGTWQDALGLVTDTLPEKPKKPADAAFKHGDMRVSADGCSVEKFRKSDEDTGRWITIDDIGGYVKDTTVQRTPSREEIDHGVTMEAHARNEEIEATIRASWRNAEGKVMQADITGPAAMLTVAPDRWPASVRLPAPLAASSSWPPRGGLDWLRAVKANTAGSGVIRTKWSTMGWAPSTSGDPVFLIGQQVLGASKPDEASVSCGLGEEDVSKASSFGVIDDYWDYVDPDNSGEIDPKGLERYKTEVRRVIRESLRLLITDKPWTEAAYGPIVLSAMLRAVLPSPMHGAMYLYGQSKSGKSYTGSVVMSGFGKRPGTWSNNNMPGGASDTQFATEQILSRMPIWVMDDLAPGLSRTAQQLKVERIDGLVRQITQGSTRRAGSATGGLREATEPRALLLLTGEQEFEITSLRQRLVELRFVEGTLSESGFQSLNQSLFSSNGDGITARLTAMMVRYWHLPHTIREPQWKSEEQREKEAAAAKKDGKKRIEYTFPTKRADTWEEKVAGQRLNIESQSVMLQHLLERDYGLPGQVTTRQAKIFADLMVPIYYLRGLYEWAGGDVDDLSDALDWENGVISDVLRFLAEQITGTELGSPGRLLGKTLVTALARGAAYIRGTDAGMPPFATTDDSGTDARNNEMLGWRFDYAREAWIASGTPIGYLFRDNQGEEKLLFDRNNAYYAAERTNAIPAGQSRDLSWQSAETDRLVVSDRKSVMKDDGAKGLVRGPVMRWTKFREMADGNFDPDETIEVPQRN